MVLPFPLVYYQTREGIRGTQEIRLFKNIFTDWQGLKIGSPPSFIHVTNIVVVNEWPNIYGPLLLIRLLPLVPSSDGISRL